MEKDFEIISFRMLKDISDNHRRAGVIHSSGDFILERLRSLAHFFEANGLATRKLLNDNGEISQDFALRSIDLTKLGMKVLRRGYKAWMRGALTRPPNDMSAMVKALKREGPGAPDHK